MLTILERRLRYAKIEERFRVRARNLQRAVDLLGGFEQAARRLGKSPARLKQLCLDDHPWRQVMGDKLARDFEHALGMNPGELDIANFKRTPGRKL